MLGKTHVIGGIATGAATGAAFGLPIGHTVAMAAASGITAKLPDVDRLINKGPNHRSLTHSLVIAGGGFLALAYYLCSILPSTLLGMGFIVPVIIWGLAIGYVSHLLLDSFTCKKIPLLFPRGAKFGGGLISTGTKAEGFFLSTMMLTTAIYLAMSYGVVAGMPESGELFGGLPHVGELLSGMGFDSIL